MLETLRSFFDPPIYADPAGNRQKVIWIVRLRWLALIAQILSIAPAMEFHVLELSQLPAFVGVISALAMWNASTWLALRKERKVHPAQILIQLSADIAALSALLALTGGGWNPMVPILLVHTVLGAMLLEGQLSLLFFGVLILCLLSLQSFSHVPSGLEATLVPARMQFSAQLVVAVVFWITTAWLSRGMTSLQGHFAFLRERKTRIDRLRAVGALAAGLSHEFATPLNTAMLRLRRLARKEGLENHPDLLAAADALDRCEEVLRHMSGAQLRPERLSLDPVNVAELVDRVCSSVTHSHDDATIHTKIDRRGPPRALLPAVAFSQALLNLIDNALQAGRGQPVEVIVRSQAGRIDVVVLDRGDGWPDVVRTHLGEPFVTTKPDGVGLGLYYVHSLSEAVGAELILEDRAEGGAAARISLPAVPTEAEAHD